MTEQENRQYAVDLLNRSDVLFDVNDIAVLAKALATLEGDIATWLDGRLSFTSIAHSVSRTLIIRELRDGKYRPELNQQPVSGKPEGNLK